MVHADSIHCSSLAYIRLQSTSQITSCESCPIEDESGGALFLETGEGIISSHDTLRISQVSWFQIPPDRVSDSMLIVKTLVPCYFFHRGPRKLLAKGTPGKLNRAV